MLSHFSEGDYSRKKVLLFARGGEFVAGGGAKQRLARRIPKRRWERQGRRREAESLPTIVRGFRTFSSRAMTFVLDI